MLRDALVMSAVWAAGTLLQAIFYVGDTWKKNWKIFLLCVVMSLFAGLAIGKNQVVLLYERVLVASFCFTFFFAGYFRKLVMPKIDESVLLIWNLLFLSVALPWAAQNIKLLIAIALPSIATFLLAMIPTEVSRKWKTLLYLWFLVMAAGIGYAQLRLGIWSVFFDRELLPIQLIEMGQIELFIGGMGFLCTGSYLWYIFVLIPIPSKSQTIEERREQWQEHVAAMQDCFGNDQLSPLHALLLIVIIGGILAANFWWSVLPPLFLVNLTLLMLHWIPRTPFTAHLGMPR